MKKTEVIEAIEFLKKYNLPKPEFYNERDCFKVIFRNNFSRLENEDIQISGSQIELNLTENMRKTLNFCKTSKTSKKLEIC